MIAIALLLCGGLRGKPLLENGDYDSVYLRYMKDSCPPGTQFVMHPYNVYERMEFPVHEDDYNCMMLTGSAYCAYDDVEWVNKLVDYMKFIAVSKPHIKLIGICFGHQIIARALGGKCVSNDARWEVGPTIMQLTKLGKELFGVNTLTLNQMHRDHVSIPPPDFHLLGFTGLTPNHGMVRFRPNSSPDNNNPGGHPEIQILTVQGHPEFPESLVYSLLEQRESSGVIDAALAQDTRRRRSLKTDGVDVVGKLIWQIILQSSKHTRYSMGRL